MTTRTQLLPLPITQVKRRFVHGWRTMFGPGDISTLVIAAILLLMPVLALEASGWPIFSRTVVPLLALSIAFGFLLARSHYNELLSLFMSGIYGMGFTLLLAAINEPGGIGEGIYTVITRLLQWLVDAATGGINQDNLVFTILVGLLFWFLGYNLTWHIFRADRVLRAILPPGLILISNNVYYTGDQNLEGYLIVFMFTALLLIVRSNLDARTWDWYVQGIRVPARLRQQFFRMGAALTVLALLIGWVLPSNDLQERLNRFQEFLQSEPLTQLGELWNRLFSAVETQGPTTTDYYGGDSLQLGGAIRLGEQVVLVVAAPPGRRYYWRSRVFDTYENGRWTPAADTRLTDDQSPLEVLAEPYLTGARDPVQQQFTIALNASRLIYAAPQPARVELPTRTDLRYTSEARDVMNISVIRPYQVLRRGDSYTATSLMTNATSGQLRAAGIEYPPYVRNLYFYLSPSVTDRTIQLAHEIVNAAGATTPYDQAKAIETWLRTNIEYNEAISQPPFNRDPVDWVLFDVRQGYCNYYASAMIVMLRSLGIPARMAAGFAQGTWDPAQQVFVVQERDAHTWVEVYFPGYGWIEFEPTAAQAPLNRLDEAPSGPQPSATPLATPTATLTPTPTVTPTPDPLTPLPDQQRSLPTVTATFTPSPTATPVIVPTQAPPLTPQPRSPFAFLLSALGVVVFGLLFFLLLAGIGMFVWWWWEWRGMGGLSPVMRAYARLERYIGLIGIRPGAQQTPEERRRQIVRQLPGAEPPVTAITRMYTTERYGPGPRHPQDLAAHANNAEEAWTDARSSILRRFIQRLLPWTR